MAIEQVAYQVLEAERFVNDDVVQFTVPEATFTLKSGILIARLSTPVAKTSEAREIVDPIVRAWEFEAEIYMGFRQIQFEFVSDQTDSVTSISSPSDLDLMADDEEEPWDGHGELVLLSRYPSGPTIRVTPEMENIWERFARAYLGIREPLQSAAYYGLTIIEKLHESRREASKTLSVEYDVLRKVGELSTVRGDQNTARKANGASKPITRSEKRWLHYTFRILIMQLGYIAAGLAPSQVTMSDLPKLV